MISQVTWKRRSAQDAARSLLGGESRYIDFGIRLVTVEQDSENGSELIPGRPPLRVLGSRDFGGLLDTRLLGFVGPAERPLVWFHSPQQQELILHGDELSPKILCYGAEGSGKTRGVVAPWLVMRALEFTGTNAEIGATAPTQRRMLLIREALREVMHPDWYTWHAHDGLFTLINGTRIRLAATKRYSEDVGSPIQGWSWSACASDELQDSLDANDDIEARGRNAPGGIYRRICSATAKDSSRWRDFRDNWLGNSQCEIQRMEGRANPFVWRDYWDRLKETLDERAYARRVLALDVGPENAVYHTFGREEHLRPVPRIGAHDVTASVLRSCGFGENAEVLVGHDPGNVRDVSLIFKAYRLPDEPDHFWWCIGECVTQQSTAEMHGVALMQKLQRMGLWINEYRRVLVIADPSSEFESRAQPHPTVYRSLKRLGFDVRSASPKKHRVPIEARIEMVVSLLRNAAGRARLFIAVDERGNNVAPGLVEALENSARNEAGEPETKVKNARAKKTDYSDFTSPVGFAFWRIERTKLYPARIDYAHH